MLMSQFTITGFDACAHMSEETKGADKSAAWAIIMAIGTSSIVGFGYILALLFSIQVSLVSGDLRKMLVSETCCLPSHHSPQGVWCFMARSFSVIIISMSCRMHSRSDLVPHMAVWQSA